MKTNNIIRIAIVDDHLLFRRGLRLILKDETSFEIIGEASNGIQAIDLISELKPDVVLLDMNMAELDGMQVLSIIRQKSNGTKVLMLNASADETSVVQTLKDGAKGYVSKNTSPSDLIKAIKAVHNYELWAERKLVAKCFDGNNNFNLKTGKRQGKIEDFLTQREKEVLSFLVKGSTNKEIAQNLFISEKTVKSHLNKIFKKLNVSRRLEAILCAIKNGL
jgi:DNA-binding NarL/FixJ family response regulator